MVEMTDEQKLFLMQHKISPLAVFDATGMKRSEYQEAMRAEGKLFAMGVSPCNKMKHTLRDRSGHCIQCDTSNIAYIKRHYQHGWVYVSASRILKMLKVGFSEDPKSRERTINGFEYGGANDWALIAQIKCKDAGRVEFEVHERLRPYLAPQKYFANKRPTVCREIFSCSYRIVRTAILDAVKEDTGAKVVETTNALARFGFPDLLQPSR